MTTKERKAARTDFHNTLVVQLVGDYTKRRTTHDEEHIVSDDSVDSRIVRMLAPSCLVRERNAALNHKFKGFTDQPVDIHPALTASQDLQLTTDDGYLIRTVETMLIPTIIIIRPKFKNVQYFQTSCTRFENTNFTRTTPDPYVRSFHIHDMNGGLIFFTFPSACIQTIIFGSS